MRSCSEQYEVKHTVREGVPPNQAQDVRTCQSLRLNQVNYSKLGKDSEALVHGDRVEGEQVIFATEQLFAPASDDARNVEAFEEVPVALGHEARYTQAC